MRTDTETPDESNPRMKWLQRWLDLSHRLPVPTDNRTAREILERDRGRLDRT